MKTSNYPYWIKQRYNPQLGTYYVGCGQMSKTAAKKHEKSRYGSNTMIEFEDEIDYMERLDELKKSGESVQA